ncbi:hypothetical protein [Nocardia sp. NPDC050406]
MAEACVVWEAAGPEFGPAPSTGVLPEAVAVLETGVVASAVRP